MSTFDEWSAKMDELDDMKTDVVFPSLYKTKSGKIIEIGHLDNDSIKNCMRYVYYNEHYVGRIETLKYMKKLIYARMIRSRKSIEEINEFLKVDENDNIEWWQD